MYNVFGTDNEAGREKIMIIGLTGLPCSGKSLVSSYLSEKYNAFIIDCDKICHEVLTEKEIIDQIRNKINTVNDGSNSVCFRKELAQIIREDISKLDMLEETIHPRILNIVYKNIEDNKDKVVIIDAPLLYQCGLDNVCDIVWFILSSPDTRLKRAVDRGWDKRELELRENRLMQKLRFSDEEDYKDRFIINDWSKEELFKKIDNLWQEAQKT